MSSASSFQYQYWNGRAWAPYDAPSSAALAAAEANSSGGCRLSTARSGATYFVNFSTMQQTNLRTGLVRPFRKIATGMRNCNVMNQMDTSDSGSAKPPNRVGRVNNSVSESKSKRIKRFGIVPNLSGSTSTSQSSSASPALTTSHPRVFCWRDNDGSWKPYDATTNSSLLTAFQNGAAHAIVRTSSTQATYRVDFRTMVQVNQNTGFIRAIKLFASDDDVDIDESEEDEEDDDVDSEALEDSLGSNCEIVDQVRRSVVFALCTWWWWWRWCVHVTVYSLRVSVRERSRESAYVCVFSCVSHQFYRAAIFGLFC